MEYHCGNRHDHRHSGEARQNGQTAGLFPAQISQLYLLILGGVMNLLKDSNLIGRRMTQSLNRQIYRLHLLRQLRRALPRSFELLRYRPKRLVLGSRDIRQIPQQARHRLRLRQRLLDLMRHFVEGFSLIPNRGRQLPDARAQAREQFDHLIAPVILLM